MKKKLTSQDVVTAIVNSRAIQLNRNESKDPDISIFKIGYIEITQNKEKEEQTIRIFTERPGLLIGRAGRFIDLIKQALSYMSESSINIELIELKLYRY